MHDNNTDDSGPRVTAAPGNQQQTVTENNSTFNPLRARVLRATKYMTITPMIQGRV